MEVTIAIRCGSSFGITESKTNRAIVKKNVKFSKNSTKEAVTVFKTEPVQITGKPRLPTSYCLGGHGSMNTGLSLPLSINV